MALADDRTAVVHYTRPNQTYDVISRIDLVTGAETVVHEFAGDIGNPEHGISPEHHGGNPIVADDGAIYVGIGDYGAVQIAASPEWNGGKIFRIDRSGSVEQLARGFRNPFDLAWDRDHQALVVPDNGDVVDDEINVISTSGGFFGWPLTAGLEPPVDGAIPPVYVFPEVVAPTGMVRLAGRNAILRHGYLLCAFVTRALYYFDDATAPHPMAIIRGETGPLIDVAEGPNGEIYIATGTTIYRLITPARGDCNGDGVVNFADIAALEADLAGTYNGSWGCDADGDGLITPNDIGVLWRLLTNRFPAVRHR
jgi:glucose/arabinose dehydrogenase